MNTKYAYFFTILIFTFGCSETTAPKNENLREETPTSWSNEKLKERIQEHHDSARWNKDLLSQDKTLFTEFEAYFESYPLTQSAFPVADYEYAVASEPLTLEIAGKILKAISVGEYVNEETEEIAYAMSLFVVTNDTESEAESFVVSRNYPYLTAQGFFIASNKTFDWVFAKSPDAYATLLVNMKLFDLRFGQCVLILPQEDGSFYYYQWEDSRNNYSTTADFTQAIEQNNTVKEHIKQSQTKV